MTSDDSLPTCDHCGALMPRGNPPCEVRPLLTDNLPATDVQWVEKDGTACRSTFPTECLTRVPQ
jgi:hypothetical protein